MPYNQLFTQIKTYCSDDDIKLITQAYAFSKSAHQNQKRNSGEPFIEHPLYVAYYLARMKLDPNTISAALLHDIIEDTPVTAKEINQKFGPEITHLVDGVSKLGQVRIRKDAPLDINSTKDEPESFHSFTRQNETLRKMFVAMAKDIRVILIKLADRLHNMETLSAIAPEKQLRIARETLEIYAPIAHRLGIGELKGRLEDLAFVYVFPEEYKKLKKVFTSQINLRQKYLDRVIKVIEEELSKNNIKGEVHGRAKHIYSLHNKLQRYNCPLNQIYDLVALRIIVENIEGCYSTLGIIHKLWKPLPGRIKDYIAVPKPNGYQSLHTVVFCLDGQITEFQIRTYDIHEQAEHGIAAHWHYKIQQNKFQPIKTPKQQELSWVKQLADWQIETNDPKELADGLKLDFFQNRIFVFTPKGDIQDLPVNASPIDFAFAVHTDIGHHCAGAKVNGKMVTLSHSLQNGDMIEIITNKKSSPKRDWLNFVKTSLARSNIRQYVKLSDK